MARGASHSRVAAADRSAAEGASRRAEFFARTGVELLGRGSGIMPVAGGTVVEGEREWGGLERSVAHRRRAVALGVARGRLDGRRRSDRRGRRRVPRAGRFGVVSDRAEDGPHGTGSRSGAGLPLSPDALSFGRRRGWRAGAAQLRAAETGTIVHRRGTRRRAGAAAAPDRQDGGRPARL